MKKMTFWMCMFMAIGSIIGAGIFARTPLVIRLVGNGLVWGFFLAAIFVFFKTVPEVILSSALPANGASYMHLTRLLHPGLGAIHSYNQLVLGTMNVAILSLTFAEYFVVLVPSLSVPFVAVSIALLFTFISTFGVKVSGWVQTVCVWLLLGALGLFIFKGMPSVAITLQDVLVPTVKLTRIWAAMGLLHGSLIGANVLMYAADEIEKPERTIPIVFVTSTIICSVLFAVVGFVSLGNIPLVQWNDFATNLATAAQQFLSPQLLSLFIVAGPLLAVATSINGMILMFSRSHFVAARDGLLPVGISKLNRFGAPGISIWFNSLIGITAIVAGFNLGDVVLMVSVPGLLLNPIVFLTVFVLPKRFPLSYKNSFLKIPHWIAQVIVVIAAVLSYVLGASVVSKMTPKTWLAMGVFYTMALIYTIIRRQYLIKKEGLDIFEKMRTPYQPWVDKENALSLVEEIA
ncbi:MULTISPECIES: APC family permease [unclassified Fusibacter]|uniref:APC family permease n=1 Tax=unclassified Fusibacter TaxID=2624464 RepID=UPI001013AD3C|nr:MULTISPECIES: APC family permease [unclassified Fusibacter]MCK8060626.1 APC family permease [Fusibacter sp. A2]NPE22920.1 amino acid permease [Fusibacter sp. A1]RXV59987.1 amino acid permease [Fusibacter sp. A1]